MAVRYSRPNMAIFVGLKTLIKAMYAPVVRVLEIEVEYTAKCYQDRHNPRQVS